MMHFNHLLVGIVWVFLVGITARSTGLTDAKSVQLAVVFLSAAALAVTVWRWRLRRAGWLQSTKLSADDHPAAALWWGLWTGGVLLIYLSLGFASAWAIGHWLPPAERRSPTVPQETPVNRTLKVTTELDVKIVERFFRSPMLQVDVVVSDADGNHVTSLRESDFDLKIANQRQSIAAVEPIDYQPPLSVLVIRDLSGSTHAAPFPSFILEATNRVVRAAAADPKAAISIGHFTADLTTTTDWTANLSAITVQLPAPVDSNKSNLYQAVTAGIERLAARPGHRTLLLIADGAHNVPSKFSEVGLAAYARSKQVVIHTIGLPTEHFQEPFLKQLAAATGGRFLRADSELDRVASLVGSTPARPACRLVALVGTYQNEPIDVVVKR